MELLDRKQGNYQLNSEVWSTSFRMCPGLLSKEGRQMFYMKHRQRLINTYPSTYILWHVHPLLGNDRKISNYTTSVAKQRLRKEACFLARREVYHCHYAITSKIYNELLSINTLHECKLYSRSQARDNLLF
jgi:hypothetical protein